MFLGGDISVTQEISNVMDPGSQQKVSVTINKADITGFAKLQFDLPEGMTATSNDTKGASFTFKDQKAKFIWMSLPNQNTFKISYMLIVDANAQGAKVINGKLSYIENNERMTFDMEPASIELGNALVANIQAPVEETPAEDVSTIDATEQLDDPMNTEVSSTNTSSTGAQDLAMVGAVGISFAPTEGQGGIIGSREITSITETEFLVTVTVEKGDIRGFGKVQEIIPKGFIALEKKSDDAIFTFQDEVVKFVWLNLPAKNTITIVYKLRSENSPEGDYSVNGEFSYLLNDETQKSSLGSSEFVVGPQSEVAEEVAEEVTISSEEEEKNITGTTTTIIADTGGEKVEEEKVAEIIEPEKTDAQTSTEKTQKSVQAPETGINYKVQIIAGHNQVGNSYFASLHNYHGMFSIEHHQGWIKYTTGQYNVYKQARDKREGLILAGHEFPGPFVTAYNDGVRVTVQEALMISNQKWFQ